MVEHDAGDAQCRCDACERIAVGRGISAFGHQVLGADWLGDEGGSMTAAAVAVPAPAKALAQHALADVFEQLERIGQSGRDQCRPVYYGTTAAPIDRRITRARALELLRLAQHSLDYARVHLDHLPGNGPAKAFELDDRVIVTDEEHSWSGTIVSRSSDGAFVVQPDDSALRAVEVDGHDLSHAE